MRVALCYDKDGESTQPAGDLDIRVLSPTVTELKHMYVPSQGRLLNWVSFFFFDTMP